METSRILGERVRARREDLGLTLRQVVDRTGGALSVAYLSSLERGQANPTLDAIEVVCRALDLPLQAALAGAESGEGVSLAGTAPYTLEEAKDVLLGYALGVRPLELRDVDERYRKYGRLPDVASAARWGYRTYDCVPAGRGPQVSPVDLLVVAGLNMPLGVELLAALSEVAAAAFEELAKVPTSVTFWGLSEEEVLEPAARSHGAHLFGAWRILSSVPGLGVAGVHQILHHKRPRLAPLVDGETAQQLTRAANSSHKQWWQIHRDLAGHEAFFADLEGWFGEKAARRGGVRLSRLRIHDILLWSRVIPGEAEFAAKEGQVLRR